MTLKKMDFVELKFTGKLKSGEIFDSNIKEDLEKMHLGHKHEIEDKSFILCLGEQMFLPSIEDFLVGKEVGEYEINLSPEKAFGNRNLKSVIMVPMKVFRQQKINPVQGDILNFDGRHAKILTVSGGRIMVDFNNPLAGKEVIYKLLVKRKIEDINEKVKALINFFFKRDLNFEIKDNKIILSIETPFKKYAEIFQDKFKEIFKLELEINEIKEEKQKNKVVDKKIQ